MTVVIENPSPAPTRSRSPKEPLNAVQDKIKHLSVNILDDGMSIWDREIALLLRDAAGEAVSDRRTSARTDSCTVCSMPFAHAGPVMQRVRRRGGW
ncbi:hypothetical protein [Streptomyces virginiae]